MKKVIIHAEVYTGEIVIADGYVRFGKEINAVGNMSEYIAEPDEEVIDAAGSRLVPGFIDVHSHGGSGRDNRDGDADGINRMMRDAPRRDHQLFSDDDDAIDREYRKGVDRHPQGCGK